jgi:hypothetical protein
MVASTVPGTPRTVSNHATTPTGSNDIPATPVATPDSKPIVISTPTDITTSIRPPAGFPPQVQKNVASSSTNTTPSAHRGVKLDQVVERQANGTTGGTTPALSAKALGKRKRTAEEEEIIYRAGLVCVASQPQSLYRFRVLILSYSQLQRQYGEGYELLQRRLYTCTPFRIGIRYSRSTAAFSPMASP